MPSGQKLIGPILKQPRDPPGESPVINTHLATKGSTDSLQIITTIMLIYPSLTTISLKIIKLKPVNTDFPQAINILITFTHLHVKADN